MFRGVCARHTHQNAQVPTAPFQSHRAPAQGFLGLVSWIQEEHPRDVVGKKNLTMSPSPSPSRALLSFPRPVRGRKSQLAQQHPPLELEGLQVITSCHSIAAGAEGEAWQCPIVVFPRCTGTGTQSALGAAQVACECSRVQVGSVHHLVQKPPFLGTTT